MAMRETKRKARMPGAGPPSSGSRDLAPTELRYQLLRPGPGRVPWKVGTLVSGIGVGSAAATAVIMHNYLFLWATPIFMAVANGLIYGVSRLFSAPEGMRAAPVAIVPWGIVLEPDGVADALPWPRIREVSYQRFESVQREAGSKDTISIAIMLFDTDLGLVQAQAEDGEWVTSVDAFAPRFARSVQRGPSADLAGTEPLETGGMPTSLALLRRAESILASADGRASLGLEAGDYRTVSSRIAGPETRAVLRAALWDGKARLDPGAMAAVLIAELRITDLLQDLLRLILSPTPLLAAVARAAALRLGASRVAAGSLDELELFLPAQELNELKRWAGV
jgi:hypothetical protein